MTGGTDQDTGRATFLFADLAGFTALTEAHGDDLAADLAGEFATRAEPVIADAGAQLVKTIGDALMVRAPAAAAAIALGIALATPATGRFPAVRVGMHTGPAVERSGDWFGATVNIAARIAALADPGQVLASDATYRAALDENAAALAGIGFTDLGEHRLRNVSAPVRLLAASGPGAPADRATDPVCRMLVDTTSAPRLDHAGHPVWFCSTTCRDTFASAPQDHPP